MKLILVLLLCGQLLFGAVVINEVCYDPQGEDQGSEWIELYNNGDQEIDLNGCRIYSGGSSYTLDYEFPHFILRPGRFILIGGVNVSNTHLSCNFSFQNGGSASDAIRFVNADSTYTDTVIYDEPNSNLLCDDSSVPASSFAPDVAQAYALARIYDGYDTDDCATDFYAAAEPSPGSPNQLFADYAISSASFIEIDQQELLNFWICNRSPCSPSSFASLKVWQDALLIHEAEISPISPADSLAVEVLLHSPAQCLEISISLAGDPNPENDYFVLNSAPVDLALPLLNEIFAAPLPGHQEWLELYQEAVPRDNLQYVIRDASGNRCSFELPAFPGYFVLCNNASAFSEDYPEVPHNRIIQSSGWISLNNDGDAIYLFDDSELDLIHQMSYSGDQITGGKSLERYLDGEQNEFWRVSIHPDGASPAANNQSSLLPDQNKRLEVLGSPFDPRESESLVISYKLPDEPSRVNCFVYDLSGRLIRKLADNQSVASRGMISWDGRRSNGSFAPRGLYILLWESQSSNGGRVYRRQLTAVIR
ncbi:MAG: lamin tail domain-containing protein [Candidatus Cloacimonetes bacterium]|nr:lamin tail domain-containing protein [Candidatus Cloacimonadota bacterium]